MEREASEHIGSALLQRLQGGADSADLTDDVVRVWRQIEAALTPILGYRGTTVLFKRSITVASGAIPWLMAANRQSLTEIDLDALREACLAQSADAVARGGGVFFKAFYDLLSSLIGASLTAQLLSSVSVTPHHDATRTPGHEQ